MRWRETSRPTTTARSCSSIKAADFRFESGRLTVHLAHEFGFCYGVDRAVDYAYQARRKFPDRAGLPDRRDHPQPARQREAARARHPLPVGPRVLARGAGRGRRGHPPGLRRHRRAARPVAAPGMHAGGHDVRVGAERVEERPTIRPGRIHRGHPRQGPPRGDPGDRVAGDRVVVGREVPRGPEPGRGPGRLPTSSGPAETVPRFSSASATPRRPDSTPTATSARSGWPTRRRC